MTASGTIIMDASVAIAVARGEPEAPAAIAAISQWTGAGARLVVPSHFWLEVANALMGRRQWSGATVLEAVHELDRMRLKTVDVDRALVVLTIDMVERHGLSAYDAAYLALTISLDGSLATLDGALRRAAGSRAVHIGPARLSEMLAVYEHPVTWPDYKGASAYLAKLRAEAARPV